MSKEAWLNCYERVYNDSPEETSEEVLIAATEKMYIDTEAKKIDDAMDLMKETTYYKGLLNKMPIQEQKIVNIFRGLPGVGKTKVANRIANEMNDQDGTNQTTCVILSSDDFFIENGVYTFDKDKIDTAHKSNFERFKKAIEDSVPYIIVDNTNIKSFHYRHYLDYAQRHNYLVLITILPHNDLSDRELEERNIHGVTRNTIRKMRADFEWEFK